MCGFKKFIVCLALLLAAALARPLPTLAVWGDDNEPMPVLFGLELGGDIREHPELEQQNTDKLDFPENWGKRATYEGISVYPRYYNTFEYKISSVSFYIKVKDFPRFRKLIRRKFGNEILRDNDYDYTFMPGYYWGKYEVEIRARYPFEGDLVHISLSYLPLYEQYMLGSYKMPPIFTYHDVTLGIKVEEYPLLHPIKEEAPDIVYYQSDEPPLVFNYSYTTTYVESETWLAYKGAIYSLELRGDKGDIPFSGSPFMFSDSPFMDQELKNIYKFDDYEGRIVLLTPELRLGDYTIYFKGPGLTVITYMPTYWRMLRAKTKLGK